VDRRTRAKLSGRCHTHEGSHSISSSRHFLLRVQFSSILLYCRDCSSASARTCKLLFASAPSVSSTSCHAVLSVARSEVARRKRGVKAESRTVIDAAHKAIGPPLARAASAARAGAPAAPAASPPLRTSSA